jgi:tripartite-type tricarboxylate transporter receptor subunit TctC
VVRAAPDGYTLGLFGAPSATNATLYDKLNFNFVRDIAPIASIVGFPYIMVVNLSVSAKTLRAAKPRQMAAVGLLSGDRGQRSLRLGYAWTW